MTDDKPIRIANARISYDSLRPSTREEAEDAVFRWRAAYPEIAAAWGGHSPTGRQPTGFPNSVAVTFNTPDPEDWGIADIDLSSFEERILAQAAAWRGMTFQQMLDDSLFESPAASAASYLGAGLHRYIQENQDRINREPIGMIGDTYVYSYDVSRWADQGVTVAFHHDGSATFDFESYGGMIGPMSGGKTGVSPAALLAGLEKAAKCSTDETNDERSWEKLRDRRHGRRKQRRRK